jgi:hypothetical protein
MSSGRIALLVLLSLLPAAALGQSADEEFFAAARKGDAAAVKALLDKGVDVNAKTGYGATALSYAADKGHVEVVRLLLERGADPNVKDKFYGQMPIAWALSHGHTEVVKLLLKHGAQGRESALIVGAGSGDIELVKAALDGGGLKPEDLSSALSKATKNNHPEVAELLKKAGATPPPPANFPVDAETLKSYAGTYKNDRAGEWAFAVKDGKLTGGAAGQPPFTLGAINKNTFAILEFDGVTLVFNQENDKTVGFTLKEGGESFEFKKVEQK